MNAQPVSSTPSDEPQSGQTDVLTTAELYQLTLYKWRYSLEAYGFEGQQVRDLMFLKWLHTSRRVLP